MIKNTDLPKTLIPLLLQQKQLEDELEKVRLAVSVATRGIVDVQTEFEAVIPANWPDQETVRVYGPEIQQLILDVREKWKKINAASKAGMANVYIFLNIGEDISVAVSPEDVRGADRVSCSQTDHGPKHRVLWGRTPEERNSAWL